ncbi:MAG: Lrp/AsnC family transcriptional regulator [Magnetospirillum sp.]|nr:Lrp/AsnC family transcriptional regulator [Magnetospirillum sp.]
MTLPEDFDRQLVLATQAGLPLVPRPYHVVAETLGVPVERVMERLAALQESGAIRRIGAVPNHYTLGYRFNGMTVWDVDDGNIEQAGTIVAALPFVSHCYQRPRRPPAWPYSLFAMVHARDEAAAREKVVTIAQALGPLSRGHDVLFSTRILKKTGLRLSP